MTGMAPVSATDSLIIDTEESVQFYISKFRESAAECIRIATRHGDYMRRVRALILNKRGRALKKLNKGDFVKHYVPPSHEEARTRKRKAKHIVQFRGPLKIVGKPSETTFKLASHFNPKKFSIGTFST
jgi:hypothetical protein